MYKTDRHFNDGFLCFADSENEEPISKYLSVDNIKDYQDLYFVNPKNTTGTIEIVYVVNGTDRIIHVEERKKGLNELESYTPDLSALGVQGYKLSDSAPSSLVYDFNKKVVRYVEMDNEKWATVTIDYDNGAPLQTIPVLKGDVVAHPGVIPTKESVDQNTTYRFLGFQKEGEAGKYNFDDVVESSFKLKATHEKQEGVDVLDNDPSYVKVTIKYVDVDDSSNPLYSTDIRREKNTVESFDIHYLTGYSPVDSFTNNQVEVTFDSDKVIEIKLKKENNIIVAFDFDNGQKTYANFSVGDKVILPTQTPEKPKIGNKTFTFKYWSLDGENKFDEETMLTRNIELIAVYEVTTSTEENGSIKIVFKDVDTNEDIQNPMLKEGLLNSFESIIIPEVDGYVFDGTEELIAVQYTTPTRVYVLSYKKLAVIEENESRIIFKFVDVDRIRLLHVEEIVGEIGTSREYTNTFTKEGYELVDPSQTSINVTFESESKIIKINYKIKEAGSYTIIFNSNGGRGNIPNIVADEDQEVTLTKNVFTKDGYKFIGWSLTADGEVVHADEAKVTNLTTGTNVTLYAKWEANKYTIKFNNNSGTGSMESIEATYDKNITLTKNSFTKSGFNFGGWSRDGSSEAEFYDEDEVKNLTTQTEVTLYAVWINIGLVNYTEEIYLEKIDSPVDKVDYTVADFLLDSDKTKVYQGLADAIATAKTTSLEGFAIKDELSIKTGTIKADGSLVLKLYFVRNRGNVNYQFDSGSHQVRLKYGDTITKHFSDLDPQIQKPNFKVAGWTCNGADYSFGETMGLDDITLKAKYQRNKWQVRFNCKVEEVDGSFVDRAVSDNNFYASSASVSYTYNVAGFEVETFYYTVPMAYSSEDEIIDVTVGADKNINRKSVNVKYELEGVGALTSGSLPATTRYKYEEEVTLPTGLAATGYNFAGFFKGAQQVSGSFSISVADCNEPTGTVVIKVRFSEFESVPYDIVYYKELGNVDAKIDESTYSKDTHFTQSDSTTLTATIDSQVTLDISTPEFMNKYAGFTPKNLSISVHSGTAGKGADRLTLEVFYVRDRHKVLFDLDGGSSGIEELEYTYKYEDVISNHFATDLPTKENYAFKHFTDISGSGAFAFGTAQMANEDINLKAIYERNKWKITYSYQEELVNGTYSQTKYVTSTEFYSKSDTFNETLTKAGFTSVNISIQIPADYSDFTNDTYSHDTIYKLNRKTVELKFVDGEPLVPFTTGSLPQDTVYKFGQTYNLPVLAKEGYTFDGYKSSVTSTYYTAGNYVVGLTDVESASITFTAEFTALPLDRGITLQYQYQKGPGDWVTIDTETLAGYDNETRTVTLKEFDEFDLVGAATLEVVFDQASKTQRVEVKKDATKWTKITFKAGPNSSVETTEFEVVIDRPFNGLHQPTINPPKINPDEGYKNMDDPADNWSPKFEADGQVSGPQTFTAQVQVDSDSTYKYTVNYLEQGEDGNTVRTAKTGYHEVGTLDLGSHPTIAGYNCVTGTTTLTITTNPASNVLNVYYEKNPAQWTKLTVVVGNKGTNPSTTEYDVIKNHPLGGDNQPKITFPTSVTAVAGYKVHNTQPWSPAYDPNEELTGPKVINANIVEDPDQWTTLTFVIGDKATASGTLKYDVIKGISLSGANQPKITLPTITSVAAGYKVHDTKPWDPAYNSTEVLTGPKTINANIVVDPDQWVDIEFVAGPNSTVTKTQFKVIKNLSFEGANQPSVNPPEISPATGYKKMDSLADYWSPKFEADGQVSGPQTFTARVQVDKDQKFSYTVNYLEQGNDSNVLHVPMTTGTHHVGTLDLGSHPTIAGYNCVTGTTMTITADSSLNVLNVYYEKNPAQWTKLTVVVGNKGTNPSTTEYDVIKNHPLGGDNQPKITFPSVTAVAGYKVHDTQPWSPAYDSTEQLTGPKTINANIVEDPDQWTKLTVVVGNKGTNPSTTEYNVIKNHRLDGANQPKITFPTNVTAVAGYKVHDTQPWSPAYDPAEQLTGPKTISANIVIDPDQWVTIEFKAGPNSSVDTTQFTVIKNHSFKGANQPSVNPPKINPDEGYKNMDDPADDWSPKFEADGQVSGPQTFTAQVEVDSGSTYKYTVNYLEQGEDGNTVRTAKTGYHEVGTLDLGSHPTIAGYNCVTGTTMTITADSSLNVLNVYYEKNPAQWTKLTVVVGNKGTNPSTTEYDVIKNHPLGGDNQPKITFPSVTAVAGYKVHDTQPWSPAYDSTEQLTGPKTINANIVEDPDQWTKLTVVVGNKGTNPSTTEYNVIKNHRLDGANQPKITFPTNVTAVAGYKVHDTQPWSPAYNATEVLTGPKEIHANIVVNPGQWVTIKFVAGENSTVTTTEFSVIKNLSFEGANQPSVNPPTINPAAGYKITNNPAQDWDPGFTADMQVSEPQTFTAKVVLDPDQWRNVIVKHIGQDLSGNYTVTLKTEPTVNVVIGSEVNLTSDSFTGFTYDTSNPATYTVTDGASPQTVNINYSRNKHTITFDPTDGSPTPNAMTDVYYDQGVLNSLVVSPAPTRTGYTLDGWTINDTGTKLTAAYKMPDENITLKAIWKAKTYKVIFHSNYGDGTDNTTEQTITYDVPTRLDQNSFNKTGYGFTGWATTATGDKEYDDNHRVTNLSTGEDYDLYAVWEFLGYDVTLNLNGGSIAGEAGDPVIKQVKEFPYTLPNATKYISDNTYYEFLGWYNTNDTTGTRYTILTDPQKYTLYAIWGNVVYHVGEYPQTKVTDATLITALNGCEVTTSQQTVATSKPGYSHLEEWYTVEYGGNKYEKVGDDYFKYEPIVCYKLSNGLYYSKYVIDYTKSLTMTTATQKIIITVMLRDILKMCLK
jgi:uncharacterized repeat protein (TIGR02543 family)